ncbi:MAG: CmcJ/NvfI family oxidoreductase [Acidobacteriota bacterium]|nr:CmcJ/NvfI family oxidoreductase [Acidobacteriota bacterium]
MVEATLNYLAPLDERPYYYLYPPPEGHGWRNTKGDRQTMPIGDARALDPKPSLDVEGFALVHHATRTDDLYDSAQVRRVFFPEVDRLVRQATGAARVVVFDHNVRCASRAERKESGAQDPVRFVHCDYTEASGPQRVRDLLSEAEAEDLLQRRFAVINVWKPIRGPVEESPLAFCDARSIAAHDVLGTDLRYRDRTGEVYSFLHSPDHRWYYYPRMEADEVLLLKCFDSDHQLARFTAHSAFDDPSSPVDAPARESIEVRTLVFY